jgi:hypothetical protein
VRGNRDEVAIVAQRLVDLAVELGLADLADAALPDVVASALAENQARRPPLVRLPVSTTAKMRWKLNEPTEPSMRAWKSSVGLRVR